MIPLWMALIKLMMMKRDELLSLAGGQGSKAKHNRHLSAVGRDKEERRTLVIQKERKSPRTSKGTKFCLLTSLSRSPLSLSHLKSFFPTGFFEKVTVNMTLCSELEEEEDEGSDGQEESPRVVDKTLTILEVLPARMGWGQIFYLLDQMCQHVVAILQQPEFYADKIKDVGGSTEGPV